MDSVILTVIVIGTLIILRVWFAHKDLFNQALSSHQDIINRFGRLERSEHYHSLKSGMYAETPRVKIGRFSISQMSNKKGDTDIWIEYSEGEGGQFRGDDLEKELEEFFNKRF